LRVAYQGEPGAFSEDAVRAVFPDAEPVPCETVRRVFEAVSEREVPFGVVPVENSQAGSINETYDLLLEADELSIAGEVTVRVDQALLGLPGSSLDAIRRVYSHPQALVQSDEFLRALGAQVVPVGDTAGAARLVAQAGDPEQAAVASIRAGERWGLVALAEQIQTHPVNYTKFAVIAPGRPDLGRREKTSVVFAVKDEPGSLYRCLQPLAERGINLTKLESRPRRGALFEYVFYMDLSTSMDDPEVAEALEEVRPHASMLRILGSYPVIAR
jgi:prephenate dehydratase